MKIWFFVGIDVWDASCTHLWHIVSIEYVTTKHPHLLLSWDRLLKIPVVEIRAYKSSIQMLVHMYPLTMSVFHPVWHQAAILFPAPVPVDRCDSSHPRARALLHGHPCTCSATVSTPRSCCATADLSAGSPEDRHCLVRCEHNEDFVPPTSDLNWDCLYSLHMHPYFSLLSLFLHCPLKPLHCLVYFYNWSMQWHARMRKLPAPTASWSLHRDTSPQKQQTFSASREFVGAESPSHVLVPSKEHQSLHCRGLVRSVAPSHQHVCSLSLSRSSVMVVGLKEH